MTRRRKSKISALKDGNNKLISYQNILKNMTVNYFERLYGKEPLRVSDDFPIKGSFPVLSNDETNNIQVEFSDEDIKKGCV